MGRHHAAKLADLHAAGVLAFSGIADRIPERALALAEKFRTSAAGAGRELFGRCDAVIVAVPTVEHFAVVSEALEAGLDVLVEKPIAASELQAERLLARARTAGRVLQVGSQEWYNPALRSILPKIQRPLLIESHRVGPFSERGVDVDVVRDLMIHDIDIVQKLLGEEPDRIEATGVPVVTGKVDMANARIGFPGGCVANLTANRVSVRPQRSVRIFQRDGHLAIDFLDQKATIFRSVEVRRGEPPRVEKESLQVVHEDPLVSQLRAFVVAVEERDVSASGGDDALAALRTALRVVAAMPRVRDLT
jgi:predicted dehydrogenase